jgi:hypothetical protein
MRAEEHFEHISSEIFTAYRLSSGDIARLSYRAVGAWALIYVRLATASPGKEHSYKDYRPSGPISWIKLTVVGEKMPIPQVIEGQKVHFEF